MEALSVPHTSIVDEQKHMTPEADEDNNIHVENDQPEASWHDMDAIKANHHHHAETASETTDESRSSTGSGTEVVLNENERIEETMETPVDNQQAHDNKNDATEDVATTPNDNNAKEVVVASPDKGIMRKNSDDPRMKWIGEGLLDLGGMEAIDRLGDISSYAELVKQSRANSIQEDEVKSNDITEEKKEPEMITTPSKLSAFLSQTAGNLKEKVTAPMQRPPPPPVPVDPVQQERHMERRRSKLLDFLANDVGERYLEGVYEAETRDDTGSEGDEQDKDEQKQAKEADERRQRRSKRANSKLLAFLEQEIGERLHDVEAGSDDGSQRHSVSSAGSSVTSVDLQPRKSEPNGLLNFVTKVIPEKPKLVIFNPEDFDLEKENREQKKRDEKELARRKVMSLLAEENAHQSIKSVDETKVQRETVTDRYGTVKLLDFLDRTEGAKQKQIRRIVANSGPPSYTSASPSSSDSVSPKSWGDSNDSQNLSPQAAAPPQPASRLARFLHKFTSGVANSPRHQDGIISHPPRTSNSKRMLPPSSSSSSRAGTPRVRTPSHYQQPLMQARGTETAHSDAGAHSGPSSSGSVTMSNTAQSESTRHTSARMSVLLSSLDQISQTCTKHELSDVSIARISTLLTSITQIVKEDMQKNINANKLARRNSNGGSTASWVMPEQDLAAYDRRAASLIRIPATEATPERTIVAHESGHAHHVNDMKLHVTTNVVESFKAFETAQNLVEIIVSFRKLLTDCGLSGVKLDEPWHVYHHVRAAIKDKLGFRQKQLFKLLDTKMEMSAYKKKPAAHKRVCVIGAGPVGLRAAVELALLGAQVVVLEKRKNFTRENILHLWPWVVQDLTSLGAKVFFPPFCHSTAYFHVGTRQMQCILLKIGLLLGITIFPSTSFQEVIAPDGIASEGRPFYTVATKPQIPWMEFTAVLGASGTQDNLSSQAGITRFVFSRKEAIGIVCYFPNHGTAEEKRVREFSWTVQFKQQMFAKLREINIDLENVVYYRGEMHYVVMTPKRQNLLDEGVFKNNYPMTTDLVKDSNIDKNALHEYVSRLVTFLEIPKKSPFAHTRVFDFSTRTRADKAASVISSKGKKLYVGLMGDTLMEPFWPEGVGTCRGFLGALDSCWMVAQIGQKSDEQILADRELAYRIIQHVSGFRRDDLQLNIRKYNADPKSRYTVKFPTLC